MLKKTAFKKDKIMQVRTNNIFINKPITTDNKKYIRTSHQNHTTASAKLPSYKESMAMSGFISFSAKPKVPTGKTYEEIKTLLGEKLETCLGALRNGKAEQELAEYHRVTRTSAETVIKDGETKAAFLESNKAETARENAKTKALSVEYRASRDLRKGIEQLPHAKSDDSLKELTAELKKREDELIGKIHKKNERLVPYWLSRNSRLNNFNRRQEREDILQEGNIGLLSAIRDFDPYSGTEFGTFAEDRVMAPIRQYARSNSRKVRLTNNVQRMIGWVNKAEKSLQIQGKEEPSTAELAQEVKNLKARKSLEEQGKEKPSDKDVEAEIIRLIKEEESLPKNIKFLSKVTPEAVEDLIMLRDRIETLGSKPAGYDSNITVMDRIRGKTSNPEQHFISKEREEIVHNAIRDLLENPGTAAKQAQMREDVAAFVENILDAGNPALQDLVGNDKIKPNRRLTPLKRTNLQRKLAQKLRAKTEDL